MPAKNYQDQAIAHYGTISILAFIFAIFAVCENWRDGYTIAFPVSFVTGLIAYCTHHGNHHRHTSVPV